MSPLVGNLALMRVGYLGDRHHEWQTAAGGVAKRFSMKILEMGMVLMVAAGRAWQKARGETRSQRDAGSRLPAAGGAAVKAILAGAEILSGIPQTRDV